MSKPVKDLMTNELKDRYGEVDSALVVNPIHLTAVETNQLRRDLRAKQIRMEVVKNSLAKRAFVGTKLEGACELLDGPAALVTGADSVIDAGRAIVDWTRKLTRLEMRGAVVEGQVLNAHQALELAKMPTRPELQGQLVSLMQSPGSQVVSAITGPAGRIAGCIKALIEKLEQSDASGAAQI